MIFDIGFRYIERLAAVLTVGGFLAGSNTAGGTLSTQVFATALGTQISLLTLVVVILGFLGLAALFVLGLVRVVEVSE